MSRRVKVSSVGAAPPPAPHGMRGMPLIDNLIDYYRGQLAQVLPDRPDLIVLPEMCDRFASHDHEQQLDFRSLKGDHVLEFLQGVARDNNCYLVYPANRETDDGSWLNSALIIDRQGQIAGTYSKNHVVIVETTETGVLCGAEAPIIECDFGRVAVAICFDLNFDQLRLKYKAARPDLILFPSMYHGGLMQAYWAYSCRSHFVGSIASADLPSEIYSPVGHKIAGSTNYFNYVTATLNLDCAVAHLDGNWSKFIELKKKYGCGVTIFDPGQLGSNLITSELDTVSVMDMVKEFDIELLDNYFERSLAHQHDPRHISQF